jgi:hypothetical protein
MKSVLMIVSTGKNIYALCIAFTLATIFLPAQFSFSREKINKPVTIDAGIASIDITPQFPIRMAGYAALSRSTETDSILQPISAKALALGSDEQHPSILITVDLVGIPWRITKDVVDFLSKEKGIDPAQIAICASHTHGGPEVGTLINILQFRKGYFTDSLLALSQLIHITQYTEQLTKKMKEVAVAALNDRKPASVAWGQGQALFAANRRIKNGPRDVALPILKISAPDGTLRGVFVNYACHGTTLTGDMHKIHGDWIAEAHRVIEARHPGAAALIALGCAGDANPSPRGTLENVQQHGKEIADNVDKLLAAQLQPLNAPPVGKMKWIKLPFSKVPDVNELIAQAKDESVKGYYARLALERVERGETIPATLDYPVQVWNFDNKMAMVNLGGEVVVDYSIRLKDEYGAERLWINSYSNDVSSYIASRRVIKEKEGRYRYEGETSMYWYNKPSPFTPEVEDIIANAVGELIPSAFKEKRPAVNIQELVQKEADGSYLLVSWLAGTVGDRIKYMPEWKAFGRFDTKDQAIWKTNIAKAGKYDVYIEYSVSDKEAGKIFMLKAGNKKLKGKIEKTGSWFTYKTKKIGTLHLSAGTLDFVLGAGSEKEKGPLFDLREVRLISVK